MKFKIQMLILLVLLAGCATTGSNYSFYMDRLKVSTPTQSRLVEDDRVKVIESADKSYTMAMTLWTKEKSTLEDFSRLRFRLVDAAVWTKTDDRIDFVSEFKNNSRFYKNDKSGQIYAVICMANKDETQFLSFTVTLLRKDLESKRGELSRIISGIKII